MPANRVLRHVKVGTTAGRLKSLLGWLLVMAGVLPAPLGVHIPGHRYARQVMRVRTIKGRRATDRPGAAEYLGRSIDRIKQLAAGRPDTGFPEPIEVETTGRGVRTRGGDGQPRGREWYALTDLDAYHRAHGSRARVHSVKLDGDPDTLLTGPRFAALLDVKPDTFRSWVRDSQKAWKAGRDGYLPRPDETEQTSQGRTIRKWRLRTAQRFIDRRSRPAPAVGVSRPEA